MKFMLLALLSILVALTSATKATFEENTYLLARDQTSIPCSRVDPFILISYDAVQDADLAHFRPASEILEQNIELLILDNCINYYGDGPVMVKEISEVKIAAERIDTVFKASIMLMGYPVVTFSKMPGDHGFITRKLYTCCQPEEEGCTSIYVRTGKEDGNYVFVFDSENDDKCAELSNCSLPSHIDLFSKVYNVRMDGPKFVKDTCALCFYVFAHAKNTPNVSISFQLLEKIDRPEIFWDFLKEYVMRADKFPTISRIFMKKYPGMDKYQLIIRLSEKPDDKILDSIRSVIRPLTGPCSSFAGEGVSNCGVNLYQSIRFNYSPITFCALSPMNKDKECYVVESKLDFIQAMAKIKGEAGFRMGRTFPDIRKTEFFHTTIECPKFDRRQVFEQFACNLFFADSRWTDCLARIELRIGQGHLIFNAFFYMVKDSELKQIQRDIIRLGKNIYRELTGKKTGGSVGHIVDVSFPSKKTVVPKHADITVPMNDGESRTKPSFTKKCAHKRKTSIQQKDLSPQVAPVVEVVEEKSEVVFDESAVFADTVSITQLRSIPFEINPTIIPPQPFEPGFFDVEAFGPIIKAPESSEIPSKALTKPEELSPFESWVYDLTEDEFENLLSAFERSLSPFHLTDLNNLPSRISI